MFLGQVPSSSKAGDMNWAHLIGDGYWFDR
jgi:hypothetical protein